MEGATVSLVLYFRGVWRVGARDARELLGTSCPLEQAVRTGPG